MRHAASDLTKGLYNFFWKQESKLKKDSSPRHEDESLSARVTRRMTQDEDVIMTRWFCDDRYKTLLNCTSWYHDVKNTLKLH